MMFPQIIQGGMGIGVSGWRLASAVSACGQLGVVSGITLDETLIRKLQMGDIGGNIRHALEHFPLKNVAKKIMDKFFNKNGKSFYESFMSIEMQDDNMTNEREDLIVAGSFVEIFLAKRGHKNPVGVNLITKVQTDCLCTLYGCMLAGVDYVIMGGGVPREIPGILDSLSENKITKLKLNVSGSSLTDDFKAVFNPERFNQKKSLLRPKFLAVISSNVLAMALAKKSNSKIDGFIVENSIAAGHNAPSRSTNELSASGEPIYGQKDFVNLEKIKNLGLPFWLAGGYSIKGKLKEALDIGATGIQSGTPFMLCEESEITPALKVSIFNSDKKIFTDPYASPTGFPFKVLQLKGSLSEKEVYEARPRVCNLGYLRERYRKEDGTIGGRCRAESCKTYVAKGGEAKDTENSKCLCNALFANIGLEYVYKNGYCEPALITAGEVLSKLDYNYIKPGITAKEVVNYLLDDDINDKNKDDNKI